MEQYEAFEKIREAQAGERRLLEKIKKHFGKGGVDK